MRALVTSRSRFRTDQTNVDSWVFSNGVPQFTAVYQPWTYWHSFADNVNVRGKSGYPDTDGQNVRVGARFASVPTYRFDESHLYSWTLPVRNWVNPDTVLLAMPSVPVEIANEVAIDALKAFGEQIPEEVSLANFLWEGRELGSLIPKLEKTLSKTLASGYLNLEFGWKPFLDDLRKLNAIVESTRSKIDHLIEINEKVTRLAHSVSDVVKLPHIRPWTNVTGDVQQRVSSYRADIHVGARLWADLEGLRDQANFWRAMTVALGLANPLKVLWEATPFSFFMDWFNRAGSRLFDLTVNPFRGDWELHRVNYSIKEKMTVEYRFTVAAELNGGPTTVCEATVERYTRFAGFPTQASIFNLDDLSPKQQLLFLALLRSGAKR